MNNNIKNRQMKKELIKESDAIIVFGTRISVDENSLLKDIEENITDTSQFVYMHPMDDIKLEDKYTQFIKYEVGSEEGVLALLASFLVNNPDEKTKEYLDDLDIGYVSGESSVGEEELEELVENFADKKNKTLIIGEDVSNHERAENISKLINSIKEYSDFNVLVLSDIVSSDGELEEVEDIAAYNGTVIYTIQDTQNEAIKGSKSFAMAARIKPSDMITISYGDKQVTRRFDLDEQIKGTVALYPMADSSDSFFCDYRFKQVRITKVDE